MGTAGGAETWVERGLEVLAARGPDAVRVEALARSLGVTKGSFYWHFRDRRALLRALLDRWEAVATLAIIDQVDARGGDPARRLRHLVRRTTGHPRAPRLEQAVRAWAASDAGARRVLARVDARREAYVRSLLVAHGLPRRTAAARTHLLYLALVGEFAWVSHGGATAGDAAWRELERLLLSAAGRRARPSARPRHRARRPRRRGGPPAAP